MNAGPISPHSQPAPSVTVSVPPLSDDRSGPDDLVARLRGWGEATPWCDWVELSGSLGRDAGDAWSDLDAGAGIEVDAAGFDDRVGEVLASVSAFAPVADVESTGRFGDTARHLQLQYADGRQLSLVVMLAHSRPGLPPEAIALVDKSDRLTAPWTPSVAEAPETYHRERTFLAWWELGDVAKHALRGSMWRAVEALHGARSRVWEIVAADAALTYPRFGAVTAENGGEGAPPGLGATLPASPDPAEVLRAAVRLADVVDATAHRDDVAGVRAIALARLSRAVGGIGSGTGTTAGSTSG